MTEKKEEYIRPSWDEYFLKIREAVSLRATCDRGKTGVVITKNNTIIATGYVGSPPGLPHCNEAGHLMRKVTYEDGETREHCLRTIHAEANAICHAAKHGVNLDGSTLYCKMEPCDTCAKLVIAAGIKRVVCEVGYHGAKRTRDMFAKAGVKIEVINDTHEKYDRMEVNE
ncbi:cytidine/deoxycytidylate deaminase family protein [Bacteroidota bacterium]